jgi:phosphate uptake regulator
MLFFKELYELWRSDNSLIQALNESYVMMESTHEMFNASWKSLRLSDTGEIEIDIYQKDQLVNRYEQDVRRKILKHLAITGGVNIIPGLVLTSIVIDIERIGDFTKNITELAVAHPAKLTCGQYEEAVSKIENVVSNIFENIIPILKASDLKAAQELLDNNWWITKESDKILDDVIRESDKSLSSGDAATIVLYTRYLKRIACHLLNITSSVINPFDKIGFWRGEET